MKKIQYFLSLLVGLCMMACSSSDGDGGGRTLPSQTITLPSVATSEVVTLEGVSSPIQQAVPQATWLKVTGYAFESGTVTVKLLAEANSGTEDRTTKVAIQTTGGEKMELEVIQLSSSSSPSDDNPVDDIYAEVTDQPAYSPVRK